MLGEDPAVVRGVGDEQDHHARLGVVALLQRDAALEGLNVVEMDLALERGAGPSIRDARIPSPQVPGKRDADLPPETEGRRRDRGKAGEQGQLTRVAQSSPVRVELEAGREAGCACRPTDEGERRATQLPPLQPAELGAADPGSSRDHPLAHARCDPR